MGNAPGGWCGEHDLVRQGIYSPAVPLYSPSGGFRREPLHEVFGMGAAPRAPDDRRRDDDAFERGSGSGSAMS